MDWTNPEEVRAEAERRARNRALGLPLDTPLPAPPVAKLEKVEQKACWRRLRGHGFETWWLSQARRTGQTKGLPDLLAFHEARGLGVWIEVKRPEDPAPFTVEQRRFQRLCAACHWDHLVGGERELIDWLRAHGVETPSL
jgi:hypothetical protein